MLTALVLAALALACVLAVPPADRARVVALLAGMGTPSGQARRVLRG